MTVKWFFKVVIYIFCCQGYLKKSWENYRFFQKPGNGAYSRGRGEGSVRGREGSHVICVIMTYCLRKYVINIHTAQKSFLLSFSLVSEQIRRKLQILSDLLKNLWWKTSCFVQWEHIMSLLYNGFIKECVHCIFKNI